MSEDQDLLNRIGNLAGQINLHRTTSSSREQQPQYARSSSWSPAPKESWRRPRAVPYTRGRGRPGTTAPNPHRNRTLVLNGKTGSQVQGAKEVSSAGNSKEADEADAGQISNGWITKRDRHMQLINTTIYDKEAQRRNKAMEETRKQKVLRRNLREKHKIQRHLQATTQPSAQTVASPLVHEIDINGIRFRVLDGGSKLARIRDARDPGVPTPKQANVGGVTFMRSKNGNLYRSGIVKAKKGTVQTRKINELCKQFTSTGHCLKGPLCPYIHDSAKVAMCKDFLQTGTCAAGDSCDLSHDPSPERVPACLHFLRGKCSNSPCRYAHVRVNPSAPVCRAFASLGYCGKGAQCVERHVHECPDYANAGICRKQKCHLPHVDRAGQIRKQAANFADSVVGSGDDDDHDLSSDDEDEMDSDDVDSDGLEEIMGLADDTSSHALTQQEDYVRF